jgi:hypothetical protein
MNDTCAERPSLLVHRARLPEHAIKDPIDFHVPSTRMPQHPDEPVLDCATVEIFDNVKDS